MLFAYLNQHGIRLSDQYLYAKNAYLISIDDFQLTNSVFNNRLWVLFPTAIFLQLLGLKYYVFSLWPFINYLILVLSTWFLTKAYKPSIALAVVALLSFNPLLINLSVDLLPDIIMVAFATSSVYLLYAGRKQPASQLLVLSIGCALTLFLAFLAKETVVFLVPFFGLILLKDLWERKHLRFWTVTIVFGVLIFAIYLGSYYQITGNALYRFAGIEGEHNVSQVWSYHGKPLSEIIARITYLPLVLLNSSPHYSYLFLLFFLSLTSKRIRKDDFMMFFGSYLFFLLFIHWLASTSLSSYNPLPTSPRMWILLLPPLCILGGYAVINLKDLLQKTKIVLPLFIISFLITVGFFILQAEIGYLFSAAYAFMLILLNLGYKYLKGKYTTYILIFSPLILLQVLLGILYQKNKADYFSELKIIQHLALAENQVILGDGPLSNRFDLYFNFTPPQDFNIRNWREFSFDSLKNEEHCYLIYNQERALELESRYGHQLPIILKGYMAKNKPHLEIENISLYKFKRSDLFQAAKLNDRRIIKAKTTEFQQ